MATNSEPSTITNIPERLAISKRFGKNHISQVKFPASVWQGPMTAGEHIAFCGKTILLSQKRPTKVPDGFDDILWVPDANTSPEWLTKVEISDPNWDTLVERRKAATADLRGKFKFIEEEQNADQTIRTPGLRPPQVGAVYSALGYWKASSSIASIVMPTGTGKTDSMIALMALQRPACLLVVVPTDALRTQLADKFLNFGVLVQFGLLPPNTVYPVVGVLKSGLENTKEIETFCDACNVIITTMPLLGAFTDLHQKTLASGCSHLFIDEAHHVKAATWDRLRSQFNGKPTLQFTATPYRNDGQHVDGKIIFNYPLHKAQEEGYFNKIVLKELWDYVEPDEALAQAAIDQLKADLENGFDHVVMARAANITKAETLQAIYANRGSEFSPVVVHSNLTQKELSARLGQLGSRQSRIAICVAMFGEGFDFPELKIAALHDIHQSFAVTIQFTGRFTRSKSKVGNATIIVNRSDVEVNDSVRELYAEGEGADWNHVLTKLTEGATESQITKENFYQSFGSNSVVVPVQNVTPKMSTVVYRTKCGKWTPWNISNSAVAKHLQGEVSISLVENTAFLVTITNEPIEWAHPSSLANQTYDLYALFWDATTQLLYINSSNNASVHEELAKTVGGQEVELISGPQAFKVMHGIKRLLLRNMGLNDRLRRSVRFMMYTGSDIQAYLDSAQAHGKEKTHVFGDGFDGKSRVTIGTSKKGRIWSWKEAKDLLEWKKWCVGVGAKLLDPDIAPESFLEDSFITEDIAKPPDLHPLAIEWPDELYQRSEDSIFIGHGATTAPFYDVSIDLVDPAPRAPIRFTVSTEEATATYQMKFADNRVVYLPEAIDPTIKIGKKAFTLAEFFNVCHPIIRYERDCFSRGDQLLKPRLRKFYIFNAQKILIWNWDGVDLKTESQTIHKLKESIQRRTIETVSSSEWDRDYKIIFDDDAPGESADVVCIAVSDTKLQVDLFHCKYSHDDPGRRVRDLYEVCGQAQRSIKWRENVDRLLMHLVQREKSRKRKSGVSRFERGTFKQLQETRNEARELTPEFRIFIVQPGLSKAKVSDDQRELLSTTDLYLHETLGIEFGVIASG